jgi:hypothetical protein
MHSFFSRSTLVRSTDQNLNPVSDEVNRFFSLARDAQLPTSEVLLIGERKNEAARGLVTGRIEELRRLEAAERGLARAFGEFTRAAGRNGELLHLAEQHRRTSELLAERLSQLGGDAYADPDDQWVVGPADRLETIVHAEQSARRTYHDHLVDLDPDTMRLVRERVLPVHDETLALLEPRAW